MLHIRIFWFQTKIALEAEDMQAQNNKLVRRVSELREQVARETSLRASLEESHNSLLSRVQEMEGIVESERDEVGVWHISAVSHVIVIIPEWKFELIWGFCYYLQVIKYLYAFSCVSVQVKSLNTTCLSLKREAVKAQEERESERALRLQLEQQIHLTTEREREKLS